MKSGDDRKRLKCAKPTHSLPSRPRMGLYSINAISTPPIGTYRKMIVSAKAGSMNSAYSCQCCRKYTPKLCSFDPPLFPVSGDKAFFIELLLLSILHPNVCMRFGLCVCTLLAGVLHVHSIIPTTLCQSKINNCATSTSGRRAFCELAG